VEKLDLTACLAASPHADKIPYLLAETHRLLSGETVQRLSSS
jgi:predicted aldo/keto reductase-like oxidoreductase